MRDREPAAPLTRRHHVLTLQGSTFGIEPTAERLSAPAPHIHTPLPGLLLAGQHIFGPAAPAAFMSGLLAATGAPPVPFTP